MPQKNREKKITSGDNITTTRWIKARRVLGWFTLITLLIIVGGGMLLLRFATLPAGAIMQSTEIMDSEGQVFASIQGGIDRQPVKLAEISPWLVKATVAVEDRRFYDHAGIDAQGLARAAWVDLRHMSKQQGASTITQQLARNLYLSHERTWTRKLKESWYAIRLEQAYTKDEIIELYLNQVYYGHGAYGAEAAARLYFNKAARELTLSESAMLAGIPKGPSYYSPHLHPKAADTRKRKVLQDMLETGQISAKQAQAAITQIVNVRPLPEHQERLAPYFADYVRKVAIQAIGIDEQLLEEGGLKIYTTLDRKMQQQAEEAITQGVKGGDDELQAALIAIDPRNGQIKAMVGGRNYKQNQYNRVFATTRQPGSSFKPIMYATALEDHAVTASTRFRSEPTLFYYDDNRQIYRPSNYNNRYFNDEIGMRQAIATSDNIYAVNTIMRVGPQDVIDMARKLGITAKLDAVPSLALGTFPVSPYEMATAFSVFAGEGRKADPIAITRIESHDGDLLYEAKAHSEQVLSPALAYLTTNLLESVFERGGTGHRVASMLKRPVAGKTGTTDSDAWFVGYTPELTTAVWIGYDRGRAIKSSESRRAAPIFAQFTEAALTNVLPSAFAIPNGVVNVYIDPTTNLLYSPECASASVQETFLAGTEPTETCVSNERESEQKLDSLNKGKSWWSKVRRWWGV